MAKILMGRGRFYDLLHRGAVSVCVFGTLLGLVTTGIQYSVLLRKRTEPVRDEGLEVTVSGEEIN